MATKKAKRVAERDVNVERGTVTFAFVGGKKLVCEYDQLSDAMQRHSGVMGINHAVGDAFSNAENPSEAYTMACDRWDSILSGVWKNRESGLLIEAFARVTKCDIDVARDKVRALDDDKRKKLAKNAKIDEAIAEIRLERAKARAADAKSDTEIDEILAEVEADADEE